MANKILAVVLWTLALGVVALDAYRLLTGEGHVFYIYPVALVAFGLVAWNPDAVSARFRAPCVPPVGRD